MSLQDKSDLLITDAVVSVDDAGITNCSIPACQEISQRLTVEQSTAGHVGAAHDSDPQLVQQDGNVENTACTPDLGPCADVAGHSSQYPQTSESISSQVIIGSAEPAGWRAAEMFASLAIPLTSQPAQPVDFSARAIVMWYVTTLWSLCCIGGAIVFWIPLVVIPVTCICSPPVHDTTSPVLECWEVTLTCILVAASIVGVAYSSYLLYQGPVWLVLLMLSTIGCVQFLSLQAPGPSFLEFVSVVVLAPFRRNLHSLTSNSPRI